jgi:hypothetical protein
MLVQGQLYLYLTPSNNWLLQEFDRQCKNVRNKQRKHPEIIDKSGDTKLKEESAGLFISSV